MTQVVSSIRTPRSTGARPAPPIGLLAGAGRFPVLFAEAAARHGHSVACVGLRDLASQELQQLCSTFDAVSLTRLGQMIRTFKRRGVKQVVMAGKVHKSVMYTPQRILRLAPDLRTVLAWYRSTRRDNKDDTLLLGIIDEFARDGITFASALDYCPELLVNKGILTRRRPTPAELRDVHFGWNLAKEMGRLDVGQSVAVKECAVLAVEAIEGTDRCIERAGSLCRSGGWTLVKVAKPQQDMRFDVPTIGVTTIESLHRAGACLVAIEAGMTIVVDQPEVIQRADALGITILALDADAANWSAA